MDAAGARFPVSALLHGAPASVDRQLLPHDVL